MSLIGPAGRPKSQGFVWQKLVSTGHFLTKRPVLLCGAMIFSNAVNIRNKQAERQRRAADEQRRHDEAAAREKEEKQKARESSRLKRKVSSRIVREIL